MNYTHTSLLCGTALTLATAAFAQITPGLYESRYDGRLPGSNYPDPTNSRIVPHAVGAEVKDNNNPGALNAPYWPPTVYEEGKNGWTTDSTFRYTGYIYIPEGSNTVTFLMNFDDDKRLVVDGEQLIRDTTHNSTPTATRTLATGWHPIDIWLGNAGGGYGPTRTIGFGIDWQGRDSNTEGNFVVPKDNGTGNLFSATLPGAYAKVSAPAVTGMSVDTVVLAGAFEIISENTTGKLRLYYGTEDKNVSSNWQHTVTYPDNVSESGSYSLEVTGLTPNTRYYCRPAFVADTGEVFFAMNTMEFTTVIVRSLAAKTIAPDSAVLPGEIFVSQSDEGELRVYYGTADAGATTGWSHGYVAYPSPVSGTGTFDFPIGNLIEGSTNYYRHAFVTSAGISFADTTRSVIAYPLDTPARFAWYGWGENWTTVNNWQNLDNLVRQLPGIPGDTAMFGQGGQGNRSIQFSSELSLGAITAGYNQDYTYFNCWLNGQSDANPATIFLDPGPVDEHAKISVACLAQLHLGNGNALTFHLKAPLDVTKTYYQNSVIYMNGPFAGGTEEAPCPISFSNPMQWTRMFVYPRNANSTWRGDISLDTGNTSDHRIRLILGWNGQNPDNAFFGDPANAVILKNTRAWLFVHIPDEYEEFVFDRAVYGVGQLRAIKSHGDITNDTHPLRPLNLGPRAILGPGLPGSLGTMTVHADTISMDPQAEIHIKYTAANSDKLYLNASAINLNGRVRMEPLDPEEHVPTRTEWIIMPPTSPDTDLVGDISVAGYFSIRKEFVDGQGWQVVVTSQPSGTLMLIR